MLFKTYNYLLKIEYDGTKFVGWQTQKNGRSIQDKIENSLSKVLNSKIKIIGAGRTDKGVHALGQHANFKSELKIENKNRFINSLNFFLSKYLISIIKISRKKLSFNSRYDAKERIYKYLIINRQGSLSLNNNRAWHIKNNLDIKLLKKGAKLFEGTHDFSTFRASSCSAKSPIKKMNSVKVKKNGEQVVIIFKSKSFLQNQVRSMVGSLKYLSSGKWTYKDFKKAFESKNRNKCAPPAPASGLYLYSIRY